VSVAVSAIDCRCFTVVVDSIPQMSTGAAPARKKYTLAEVFGDDDDDEEQEEETGAPATADVIRAGTQDYGRPPVPAAPGRFL